MRTDRAALPAKVEPGGRFAAWAPAHAAYVVCDVDGTLIGPADDASERVVDAVARAEQAGLRVGFATGRMRRAVEPLWRQLAASGPHILHNGAEVRAGGTTIAAWTLDAEQVDGLLAIARARDDVYVEIYTEHTYLASAWDERAEPHWLILGAAPDGIVDRAADLGGAPVLKATFAAFDPAAVPALERAVVDLGLTAGPAGSPRTPTLQYVNATHPEADKGAALGRAAAHLGLELRDVAAVGDATNDLSMLGVAGTAIAMGQAPVAVRDAAHLIVPEVDQDGVAVAIEALVGWRDG